MTARRNRVITASIAATLNRKPGISLDVDQLLLKSATKKRNTCEGLAAAVARYRLSSRDTSKSLKTKTVNAKTPITEKVRLDRRKAIASSNNAGQIRMPLASE